MSIGWKVEMRAACRDWLQSVNVNSVRPTQGSRRARQFNGNQWRRRPKQNPCSNSAIHAAACCLESPGRKRRPDKHGGDNSTLREALSPYWAVRSRNRRPIECEINISCRLQWLLISELRISGWRKSVKQPEARCATKRCEKRGTSRQTRGRETDFTSCSDFERTPSPPTWRDVENAAENGTQFLRGQGHRPGFYARSDSWVFPQMRVWWCGGWCGTGASGAAGGWPGGSAGAPPSS